MSDTRWLDASQQAAWRAYLDGTTQLRDQLDRQMQSAHALSLAEYEILVRLSEAPDQRLRMSELASALRYSRSRLTHMVLRMSHDGLVERVACGVDGRGVFAELTATGFERLREAAHTHVTGVRRHLVDLVDPADLEAVRRVFAAVAELAARSPDDADSI